MSALPVLQSFGGLPVLFVMAAEAEYGPELRARILPLMTGVGPVEAAVSLTAALSAYGARMKLPQLIVSLGSAGSRSLDQGRVYQVGSVSWRDMDASALGFQKGRTPFLDLPPEVDLPIRIPGLPVARLSTGGNVVAGAGYEAIDADMVDMETWALMRAADRFGIPLLGLRGISDGAGELTGMDGWTALLGLIDRHLAQALDGLEAALARGDIAL